MVERLVHLDVAGGIATITLDSPANRNALSSALVAQLLDCLDRADADPDVRAIVVTHTGPVFCAGADLTEMTAGDTRAGTEALLAVLRRVVDAQKPVIARITGSARAGGIGLVGAADLAIAPPSATFAFTEVRLGLAPVVISLTTSSRMDERAAARYYLTGDTFDGEVARAIGLLTDCADDVDGIVDGWLASIRRCSPQGLAQVKALTAGGVRDALAQHGADRAELSGRLFASAEAQEAMRAFLERRPPRWASADG